MAKVIANICVFILPARKCTGRFVCNVAMVQTHNIFIYLSLQSSHTITHSSLSLLIPCLLSLLSKFHWFFSNPFFSVSLIDSNCLVSQIHLKTQKKAEEIIHWSRACIMMTEAFSSVLKPTSVTSWLPSVPSLEDSMPLPSMVNCAHRHTEKETPTHSVQQACLLCDQKVGFLKKCGTRWTEPWSPMSFAFCWSL